jgi:hypothetical protein
MLEVLELLGLLA